jgi:starch synthase (maltosyl-transferring)
VTTVTAPAPAPSPPVPRPIVVEAVEPELDAGRHAIKRVVGDTLVVRAAIFKDGHDLLAARVRLVGPDGRERHAVRMTHDHDSDRWSARLPLAEVGWHRFTVEAWTDTFATWRSELEKKWSAAQDIASELLEGAEILERAAALCRQDRPRRQLARLAGLLRDVDFEPYTRVRVALAPELLAVMEAQFVPHDLTAFDRGVAVFVDRERARFAAWYELFPRSATPDPKRHGTFADAAQQLDRVADLGFDVVYLPPIHPIGVTHRKGRNNALTAGADDPGSPWAIGSAHGGHTAVDPRLGTLEDFDRLVARARALGLEVALDYALQCSPDHPWLKEHPEWFFVRPDGTIKYAENPPKKYQDIYPLNFWCDDREALWAACRDVLRFWIDHGVRTFRVDNPHTKALAFWEWAIAEIRRDHPDVVFLAEAFTRPSRMRWLAKAGFTQSYTYFTWRNTAPELREYLTELTQGPMREYFRGNLFANTPDILPEYLQTGGRAAFSARLLLAATLSPLYGIYSGFELLEATPVRPGSEEYLDSEKYELRVRAFDRPGHLGDEIRRINRIRREHRALQRSDNLRFHPAENDQVLWYHKAAEDADLLIAVNCDPHRAQETMVHVPLADLGLAPYTPYVVEDLLTGARYIWQGVRNYVRLDPAAGQVGHVLRLVRDAQGTDA